MTFLNLKERIEHIPFTELSKTFQDVVTFTKQLGIGFIWIDSLCIVQDDPVVLKACQDPYVSFHQDVRHIKLKKDYIPGFGDSADLVVVGGRRDATEAQMLRMGYLSWTTSYLACLENKDHVRRFDVKPRFRIVGSVNRPCLSLHDLRQLNNCGERHQIPFARQGADMDVQIDFTRPDQPTKLFKRPIVVEVIGAGFDKPADTRFFNLRFPRIQKVHGDRPFQDALSFAEYQRLAEESRASTEDEDEDGRIMKGWLTKLGASGDDNGDNHDRMAENDDDLASPDQTTETTSSSSDTESQSIPPFESIIDLLSTQLELKEPNGNSADFHETSQNWKCYDVDASITVNRLTKSQTQNVIEIADSQPDSRASTTVSCKRKISGRMWKEISPPQERLKRRRQTPDHPVEDAQLSISYDIKCAAANGRSSDCHTSHYLDPTQSDQGNNQSLSASAMPILSDDTNAQTNQFSAKARDFVSKIEMPILVCGSFKTYCSALNQLRLDLYRELAASFTFCLSLFVNSIQASCMQHASPCGNRPCWRVAVVGWEGHRSFFAEIEALVAMIEQTNAQRVDFHLLFADGSLFESLAKDDSAQWAAAIKGYLRYEEGRVDQIIYGDRFSSDFLHSIL